jgi:hypothetical protein
VPDLSGHLSPEEHDRVRTWLREHNADAVCPICGNSSWTLADQLALTSIYVPGTGVILGRGFPAVLLVCTQCAFFRMHSAIMMGLAPAGDVTKPRENEVRDGK